MKTHSPHGVMTGIPDEVIGRYAYKRRTTFQYALTLFADLEMFLDGAANSKVVPKPEVDQAWHEFILHTKLYAQYCGERYGRLIHHVPTSPVLNETDAFTSLIFTDTAVNDCSSGDSDKCSSDCSPSCKSE